MSVQRYVSGELTHFVGRALMADPQAQYKLLIEILQSGWLKQSEAPNEIGYLFLEPGKQVSSNEAYAPRCICFCDIPAGDLEIHMLKYGRFGIGFSKSFLVDRGANPVFYVASDSVVRFFDQAKWVDSSLSFAFNHPDVDREAQLFESYEIIKRSDYFDRIHTLLEQAMQLARQSATELDQLLDYGNVETFLKFHLFSFLKFFDSSKSDDDPDNYYMEREWRILGDVRFSPEDVSSILLPRTFGANLRDDLRGFHGQVLFTSDD